MTTKEGGAKNQWLECPHGHRGPWRYVETIEVWRDVLAVADDEIVVNCYYESGPGYDDADFGNSYLECRAATPAGGMCVERIALPRDLNVIWGG